MVFTALKVSDVFGHSVSLDGDRLAVGAQGDDGASGSGTGAVYVFKKSIANVWSDRIKIRDIADEIVEESWQNFKTSTSTAPRCDAHDAFGKASLEAQALTPEANDYNKWVCFRVNNAGSTHGYIKHQIKPRLV